MKINQKVYRTFLCRVLLGELRMERFTAVFVIVLFEFLQLAAQLDSPVNWLNL